jgi:Leucine-rich repeat (LRR) protein
MCRVELPQLTMPNEIILTVTGNHFVNRTNAEVTKIGIYYKQIKYLPQRLSVIFRNVIEYDVGFNDLEQVQRADFRGFSNLKVLNLEFNSLKVILDDTFRDLKVLECLRLSNNRIWTIRHELFSFQRNLKEIYLDDNDLYELSGLSSMIINNRQLNTMMLQNNKIFKINPFTFASFERVDRYSFEENPCSIDMKNCKINCNEEKKIENEAMERKQSCRGKITNLKQEIKNLRKMC